ncbi:MAG: HEAT repeat domain-containing protein [Anaerolinea sp.]
MDKRLIHLLDSSDVSERERAIKAMARSGSPDYIGYLNAVVKTDPDAGLRSLAAKAIQYIQQKSGQSAEGADEVHGRTTPKRVEVSAANERRAASMLDRAMELSTRHQDEAARELVMKAYQLDPNIRLEAYKRGIVGTVMGMGADQAFDLLDEQIDAPSEKAKRKTKEKNDASSGEDVSWGTAILDLLIYGAVIAVTMIVGYFLLIQVGGDALRQLAEAAARAAVESGEVEFRQDFNPAVINDTINALLRAGMVFGLTNAIATAVTNMIGAFIASVFIHIAAKVIGGEGSLPRLINKTVPIYTIFYVVWLIVSAVSALIIFSDLMRLWEQNAVIDGTSASILVESADFAMLNASTSLVGSINLVMLVVFLVITVGRIASAYNFSWVRGCVAYILSIILMGMVTCGLFFILMNLFATSLSGTFTMLSQ